MKYEQPPAMSRQELEAAFQSGSGERIREALISASYSEEAVGWLDGACGSSAIRIGQCGRV
jgi:hypothetical protein